MYYNLKTQNFKKKTLVAIGKFDGVHKGHQTLLSYAVKVARQNGLESVALMIISNSSQNISDLQTRASLIKSVGIDKVCVQDLNDEFKTIGADKFVGEVLYKKLNCAHVVVGYNFRFAKDRAADANDLKTLCKKNGIECTIIPQYRILSEDKTSIDASSSDVKQALILGDIEKATLILGRPYSLCGKVFHGNKIGRTINIPTANISADGDIVIPKSGVYMTSTYIDGKKYPSLTNIGTNPTVGADDLVKIETNILEFDGDIYCKDIEIEFIKRIRDEMKFDSLEELKKQIESDIKYVKEYDKLC